MNIDRLSGQRIGHIERRQFYLFLDNLAKEIREAQLTELEYELGGIVSTYDALIDYFKQGVADPERDRVYHQLVGRALQLSDLCAIAAHAGKEFPYYIAQYKTARRESLNAYRLQLEAFAEGVHSLQGEELKQLATTHDRQLSSLFTDLWTQGAWSAATAAEADALLLSPTITCADQCTIVSAVTLSLLRMFDPLKMLFLCDAYYHPEAMVSMRALVGIVIACYCWNNRIGYYGEVKARLDLLCEDPLFGDQACEVILQFTRSTDTEEVDRKMREEIIPELMKNPKLRQMPNIKPDDPNADDINPDWEEWMHESGLEESMREITEWQMEGVDVNMSTFSQLKRYPFFYNICNWFRPFDAWQADMLGIVGSANGAANPIAETILQSNFMCDSDKYSFCYAIREIPEMQRNAMMSQLEEQNRALKENADMPDLKRLSKQTTQSIMRQYVQNLYRFFKLFTNAQEFDNPFEYIVQRPERTNPIRHLIVEPERLFKIIGLNIKQKRYMRAIEYFICVEESHPECMEAAQLQQLGLCYQKLKMYPEAIEAYVKADLMKPDSYWTIHHLAQCYREQANFEKALECYEMAETMKPDNLSLTFHVAEMLYELGEYEAALPRLHKIDYHHPESLKSLRMLAECHFLCEQSAQATKCYERMIVEHAAELTSDDWRFAAYNYWVQGNRDECFRSLSRAEESYVQETTADKECEFADVVFDDIRLLASFGARKDELGYMYDAYYRTKRG